MHSRSLQLTVFHAEREPHISQTELGLYLQILFEQQQSETQQGLASLEKGLLRIETEQDAQSALLTSMQAELSAQTALLTNIKGDLQSSEADVTPFETRLQGLHSEVQSLKATVARIADTISQMEDQLHEMGLYDD